MSHNSRRTADAKPPEDSVAEMCVIVNNFSFWKMLEMAGVGPATKPERDLGPEIV